MMWVVGKETGSRAIVMLIRPPRKKLYRLTCFCKRRRKDGTCARTDGIRPLCLASQRSRIRLAHPEIDETLHPLPEPDTRAYKLTPETQAEVEAA